MSLRSGAWTALGLLLALAAALGWGQPAQAWDWQPALALAQPWRWLSPVAVHYSGLHLAANGLGLALVVVLGRRAGCGALAALAWAIAWPLTHLGLLVAPALLHYGGLSGVLHAGVAVAGVALARRGEDPHRRRLGALLLLGLVGKLLFEAPWRAPVQAVAGWDFGVATIAHATGAFSGAATMGALLALGRRRS